MKLFEITQPEQERQVTESSMEVFEIHRVGHGRGVGVGYLYQVYNDKTDREIPVTIAFDFELPLPQTWDEPSSGGQAEITSATTQNGQRVPLDSFKYDSNRLLIAIGDYVDEHKHREYEREYD